MLFLQLIYNWYQSERSVSALPLWVRKIIIFVTESCFPEAYCDHKCPMGCTLCMYKAYSFYHDAIKSLELVKIGHPNSNNHLKALLVLTCHISHGWIFPDSWTLCWISLEKALSEKRNSCHFSDPAGTVRRPNQSWTNIICSGTNQSWTNPEPWLNGGWTNLTDWFYHRSVMVLTDSLGYGSHTYVRIRSHFGSAEPILNQKCLKGGSNHGGPGLMCIHGISDVSQGNHYSLFSLWARDIVLTLGLKESCQNFVKIFYLYNAYQMPHSQHHHCPHAG